MFSKQNHCVRCAVLIQSSHKRLKEEFANRSNNIKSRLWRHRSNFSMNSRERNFFISANFHFTSPREVYHMWWGLHSLFLFIFFQGFLWKKYTLSDQSQAKGVFGKIISYSFAWSYFSLFLLLGEGLMPILPILGHQWLLSGANHSCLSFPCSISGSRSSLIIHCSFPLFSLHCTTDHGREKVGKLK